MLTRCALALVLSTVAWQSFAADCAVEIEGNDLMKFNVANIDVSQRCKAFTIRLKHVGKLSRNVMGHNVVVADAADVAGIDADGIKAGVTRHYVKPEDPRVVAFSPLIGGGETTSLTFQVAKLGKDKPYVFFCSFPGHSSMMRGTLTLVP